MTIEVRDIMLRFGERKILDDLSLKIKNRELTGIIGPNGSGKSSLLKCIYRTMQPDEGRIFFDGKNISEYTIRNSAQKMAVVAQHNFYSFDFAVQDVVLMGRSPHKKILDQNNAEDYRIVEQSLEKVGMLSMKQRNFSTLSGGEQQRVILARALTQQTACIILDEPTNHLDIKYQLQMMDIVKQTQLTVFAAIHDLNIAAMYCDWIFALKEGKIIGFDRPHKLLTAEFIYDLYGVRSKVIADEMTGQVNIMYQPAHLSRAEECEAEKLCT